MEALYKLRRRS